MKSAPKWDGRMESPTGRLDIYTVIYSTLRGKTDKLEEPVNREINVTRSGNFIQTVILA